MKGYALHIGLNYCNPRDFADCQLDGAVPDALALRDATSSLSFQHLNGDGTLLDGAATESGIIRAIESAAATVQAGELLMVTFNGLGVPLDFVFELPELQRRRGWVTYDGKVVDVDEILEALSDAPKGARILVISSCCFIGAHPGSPELAGARAATKSVRTSAVDTPRVGTARYRRAVLEAAKKEFEDASKGLAVKARFTRAKARGSGGAATVYHLGACGIDEIIPDGTATERSPFVATMIDLLTGDPRTFSSLEGELKLRLDPDPQLEKLAVDAAFDAAGPFLRGGFPESRTA
jgi:hypothetical protein